MNSKIIILSAFVLVALVQLYVPADMIWSTEDIIRTGVKYRFKTAPVDPYDPFRGKYINLNFDVNRINVESEEDWERGEKIYLLLSADEDGFAKVRSFSKERPVDRDDFLEAKVRFVSMIGTEKWITIDYPFDRYYMEESKAYDAELTYRESQRDTSKITYAIVWIKDGEAVLTDVLIDGTSIREIVKSNKGD